MSQFTFFASNTPLDNVKSPHVKHLSINEAVAHGIEIPNLLPENFDRDKPNVLLWVDDEENLGDITIYEASWCKYKSYSKGMKYNSIIEWVYSEERAKRLIDYIRNHLKTANSLELWQIWLDRDNEIEGSPENIVLDVNALTASELGKHLKYNNDNYRPVCIIIRKG